MTDRDQHLLPVDPPPIFPASAARGGGRLGHAAAVDAGSPTVEAAAQPSSSTQDASERAAHGAPGLAARPYTEIAVADTPQTMASQIIALASNPNLNVETLQALVTMQERMEKRQAEIAFTEALASLPAIRVKKNGRVELGAGKGSYPFARWEDISLVIEPLLSERGFRLTFDSQPRQGDGGGLVVTGTLLHRGGHSRSASMPLALDTGPGRNNLQAMGSSLSYGKRYCTEMLLNVVREGDDDDAVRAGEATITDQQVAELSRSMTEVGFAERAMYDLLGVTALTEIRKSQLAIARNAIGMRQRQRGKA